MAGRVEFYFDFMSPFAYLAHCRLVEMQAALGFKLDYRAIDLSRAKVATGNTGPSNRQLPVKLAYLMADLQRWADRYGVPFTKPATHNSHVANIGMLLARERGCEKAYATAIWARTWGGGGGDFASPALLQDVAATLAWNPDEFADFVASPDAKSRYREETDAAVEKGVFGVPMMIADDKTWWGNDRLFMLEEHLKTSPGQTPSFGAVQP